MSLDPQSAGYLRPAETPSEAEVRQWLVDQCRLELAMLDDYLAKCRAVNIEPDPTGEIEELRTYYRELLDGERMQ